MFSGWQEEGQTYDHDTWQFEKGGDDPEGVLRDPTLEHPRCVFQTLRRHYQRYTPEMVQEVCGIPPELFQKVADAVTRNSGPERTMAQCYAVGYTHQSKGVQIIRSVAVMQLLLGNIGRPGGGIMALRGHASIQGSTDIPTLYDTLPGYLSMPAAKPDNKTSPPTSRNTRRKPACGTTRPSTWSACSRRTTANARRRRTTSATTGCPSSRRTIRISSSSCGCWTTRWTAISSWARTRRWVRRTRGCNGSPSRGSNGS